MSSFKLNERLQLAFDYLYNTGRNVFLTGKAGTGKTTFLRHLKESSPKRMIVTSPTGVAAINAGGVTLHSFFQLPLGPQTPDSPREQRNAMSAQKIQIIKSLELLVIDEISMVRADLLDSVDVVLRRYRRNNKPFGGVQLLLIGDMQQLSPVVRPEDEEILRPYYSSFYFFGSLAWQKTSYVCIELNEVFRQTDQNFVSLLNNIREGRVDSDTINKLNSRYISGYQPPKGEDIVTLVTTNRQADNINHQHMLALNTEQRVYDAEIKGDFPESSYPIDKSLILKVDTVVMFLKNDTSQDKLFYNGKIGRVTSFDDEAVYVRCNGETSEIRVTPMTWENTKYEVNPKTKEITESVVGSFKQVPLRTAWAVTIHKSQGLTFDKLMIDAANSFAHGQVYVALSRCRTLEGLVLLRPLSQGDIISDPQVRSFAQLVEQLTPNSIILGDDKRQYFFDIVADLFDFNTLYVDIQQMQRLLAMYSSSLVGTIKNFDGVDSKIFSDLMVVSDKFMQYVRSAYASSPDLEKESTLIQRIQNGCEYYVEKLNLIVENAVKSFTFDCDDKAKKSKITEMYKTLSYDYDFKKNLLVSLKDNFTVSNYQHNKAHISLDLLSTETSSKSGLTRVSANISSVTSKYISKNPELYSMLNNWRKSAADSNNVEPADIVSTRTLVNISNDIPSDVKALSAVKGMGGKAKKFSADILRIIFKYLGNKGTLFADYNEKIKQAEFKSMSTAEQTFAMLNLGKTPEQISTERRLTLATILGHLAKFVASGEIPADKVLPHDVIENIKIFMLENPGLTDKQIIEKYNGRCSYGELSIVKASMQFDE